MTGDLEIQRWLRSGFSFEQLLAEYGIKTRRHNKHPHLVLFKYDQIASPFGEKIVRECRGIVLDEERNWAVVSRGFDKFLNHGERHAAEIDWSTAKVQEKVDGSLCVVYAYAGEWHVATTGTPDGSGNIDAFAGAEWSPRPGMRSPGPRTFAEYFWQVVDLYEPFGASILRRGVIQYPSCFFFELCGPLNRIVVEHREASLTVLGGRRLDSGQEMTAAHAAALLGGKFPAVREFPLQSFDDIARSFAELSPLSQEGYVVVDHRFNRVKVKHPGYVALHHAKGGLSTRAFVDIARSGETSEVVVAFPEYAPMVEDARDRVETLVRELEADYARLRDIPEQKAFALQAVKTRCSAAMFQARAGKVGSMRDFVRGMRVDNLMAILGYKRDEPVAQAEAA